jgi:molybdate transport system ATP-binding protein
VSTSGPGAAGALSLDVTVDDGRHGLPRLRAQLTCPPGITCVVGASGAGKSTLLGVIAGLVRPSAGRVAVGDATWFDAGRKVDVPAHRRRVAFVFQRLALFPHLSAAANVEFGMARTLPAEQRRARAVALLERVGVGKLADARPRTLSGGEAQRVALARALGVAPQVMLLDEPFSALDPNLRAQLTALLRELAGDLGVPVVHVTHNPDEVRALATQAVHVRAGAIAASGDVEAALASWLDPPARG